MLEIRGLNAGYGKVQVLWDVSLSVGDGEIVTLVARGITQVPEGRRLFPQMTVRENLLMGAYRC